MDVSFDCLDDNCCLFDISGVSPLYVDHILSINSHKILSSSLELMKLHFFADVIFCIYTQSISLTFAKKFEAILEIDCMSLS